MNLCEIITSKQSPELDCLLDEFVAIGLAEFKQVLADHPLQHPSPGCLSVPEAFWLYFLVQAITPEIVVESGSFEGYSLHFLRQAAPVHARVYAFDPFVRPKIPLDGIEYYACDWTRQAIPDLAGSCVLIFFDDHVHQGRRFGEVLRRGIQHVVFHDNYVTSIQSHVPIRFCDLVGRARICFTFENLRSDPVFTDTSRNPQNYRWLTYLEAETGRPVWARLWRRLRYTTSL